MAGGVKVFFDGGCRPGGMEWAVVMRGEAIVARDLGPGSSMEAEWLALIAAMRLATDRGLVAPVLVGDAAAVIAQASGRVRTPPSCAAHRQAFEAMPKPEGRWRLRHVRRAQNLAGIVLARR